MGPRQFQCSGRGTYDDANATLSTLHRYLVLDVVSKENLVVDWWQCLFSNSIDGFPI